ncbi:aminoacyl-histidine dipeptidase [Testudinibacter sp. TR-2022]|uniref:aminoacyl-histidine dipeptidase n=1 Tax=Testudinibacter sp. TR-2022 TaxID=2585029 RepID=UPI0011180998|nr:aminoacyl-histidine dipeptidase [Testudinibacter sp. TR-2022]TNH01785.1 aminoacyl-histidine dipeptidase [Pasteurellaceae bacterium Phil31]TNH07128.1 aminoacyl-histidine dipeptidase [Testudinibacter sp. TR-2022]TNH07387.1 aminoacyl-histidine dipeptidase [Testudinibacter sp. TR-2022]TNH13439.1 aminoacyl-histidine dipeptidase [Testudinibacter sp. TR-2022]
MQQIKQLQPTLLWQWFQQICDIPHPSYQEEQLAEHIVAWAKQQQLWVERDEVGNILIRKAATAGMQNRKKVALQAHLDMVPQKNEGTVHDFSTDPIRPYIDGEWVTAENTTLGADNGIGLASALAVLASDDLAHPDLEVLLTMTEESGMIGANGLQPNWLQSEILINTDTEENGQIYIGCAGGIDGDLRLDLDVEANSLPHAAKLVLKGLKGGHSGADIHTGRGNAIKLLGRVLAQLQAHFDFQVADIGGGSVRNAIPREAFALLAFDGSDEKLQSAVAMLQNELQAELAFSEPTLELKLEAAQPAAQVINQVSTDRIIDLLNTLPNGVIRNSDVVSGVVETSLSIGVLKLNGEQLQVVILIRSLIESGKHYVCSVLDSLVNLVGAEIEFSHDYPGWEPNPHSAMLPVTQRHYQQILGEEPIIQVIHAGLECGLIKKHYPNLDMVSIGPTIRGAHSPDERVHIPAVQTYWALLTALLANIPQA